jgi:hypothetical protein
LPVQPLTFAGAFLVFRQNVLGRDEKISGLKLQHAAACPIDLSQRQREFDGNGACREGNGCRNKRRSEAHGKGMPLRELHCNILDLVKQGLLTLGAAFIREELPGDGA